ncbi:hypothetical protein Slin15195_G021440 [Septoria linicola]|uniref:Myb-like domain-containing protein n=1 Tax=Septoria linicola TaxID=215465 RepID=A0A9Q9EFD0_9PEZI|nr:hypothetical protein Slin14017_G129430 [Septoria linicola]USW48825.1 hypothetical protein Slin15195_G021440 [Septoria linicola]
MTSGQVYPTLPGTVDPLHMGHEATAGVESSEWYALPSSYVYNHPYITPYPSSTVESQPWTQYARASAPDINLAAYGIHQPVQPQHTQMMRDPGRPRSSPSTFGPSPDSIPWTTSGLGIQGIQYTTAGGHPTPPVTSTFPPNVFQTYPTEEHYSTSSPPEIRQPRPRRAFTSIAPSPLADAGKRKREDVDIDLGVAGGKRRKRATSVASQADLSGDDRFLVQLKEDESLAWKDIAARFMNDKGKNFQVAALQMRYKRLREKFRTWEDQDVQALKLAHEYWEKYKWEIISAKMLDFGVQERWPARHCARKWTDLEAGSNTTAQATTVGVTPASLSSFSSPVDATGPMHFAFMPMS